MQLVNIEAEPATRYAAAALTTFLASGGPSAEIRSGAKPISVREVWAMTDAATRATLGLLRPAARGVSPTATVPFLPLDPDDTTPGLSVIATAWTTAPTFATGLRHGMTLAAIGEGMLWTFGPGELIIPANGSLSLHNFGVNPAIHLSVTIEE